MNLPCSSTLALLLAGLALVGCGGESTHRDSSPKVGGGSPPKSEGGSSSNPDAGSSPSTEQTSEWSGHTYLLSLSKYDWTAPRGVGSELFGFAPAFILKVAGSGNTLTATLATAPGTYSDDANVDQRLVTPDHAVQEPCGVTTEIPFSDSDYPASDIAPSTKIPLFVKNTAASPPVQLTADVYGLKFTDVLPNAGTPSTTGTFEATMDFRQLYVLFTALGPTRTPDTVCRALRDSYTPADCTDPSCAVQCEACPDDQPYCLSVKAEGIGAVEAPNLDATEISASNRARTCADSPQPQ